MDVFSIISLIIKVGISVDKAVNLFDNLKNAPDALQKFRLSVARLQRQFEAFQADLGSSGLLHEDDLEQIGDTLRACDQLFQEHEEALQCRGVFAAVLRGTWPTRMSKTLARYKAQIDEYYQQILTPIWIRSIRCGASESSA